MGFLFSIFKKCVILSKCEWIAVAIKNMGRREKRERV